MRGEGSDWEVKPVGLAESSNRGTGIPGWDLGLDHAGNWEPQKVLSRGWMQTDPRVHRLHWPLWEEGAVGYVLAS